MQEAAAPLVQRVVPDGCVDLIWGPDGPHVAGPDTGHFLAALRPGERFTGIRFRPGAVGEVFGVPPEELRQAHMANDVRRLAGVPLGRLLAGRTGGASDTGATA